MILLPRPSSSSVLVAGSQTKSRHFTSANMLCCCRLFQMMKHAWDSYRQYGWGHNELKPLAKKGHSTNIFGRPDEPLRPTTLCANWQFAHTRVHALTPAVLLTLSFLLWTRLCHDASSRMHVCFGRGVCERY